MEFKLGKPRETFHFNPPISIEGSWMIRLASLEVCFFIFDRTEKKNKFELYIFLDSKSGGVSYEKVSDENGKDLEKTDITATVLQDEIIGPIIFDDYRKKVTNRMKIDKYMDTLASYNRSIFQDFESYLRTEVDLVEDDIRLVFDELNPSFITYELKPRIYTFKDLSEPF